MGFSFFDNDTVNAANYLTLLTNEFYPALQNLPNFAEMLFQQDGAPADYALIVRAWLDQHFQNKWIGRRGGYCDWPATSPDLTPSDFFMCGYLKNMVYREKFSNRQQLRTAIVNAFREISPSLCVKMCLIA